MQQTQRQNTGRGSLWEAKKKTRDGETYWNGSIEINGVEYFLSMFTRKPREKDTAGKNYPLFEVLVGDQKTGASVSEWGSKPAIR